MAIHRCKLGGQHEGLSYTCCKVITRYFQPPPVFSIDMRGILLALRIPRWLCANIDDITFGQSAEGCPPEENILFGLKDIIGKFRTFKYGLYIR